ncbi:glycosyltransferase family 2 protein [Flavobacterium artemisiae]|uniref:Glycosyltransferase family 2 protein n=1 Tax=Flavobacterium artemisiae TaxID=2126556 RepID=A0ABW4H913_9FLAO
MDNQPLISVIVPNYNHGKFLEKRLDSIFKQTYNNFEVILLDDCSTDNSREILSKYADDGHVSHCVFNETNSGNTFRQWKKGIELAKGKFIWIAESDDFCDLSFLEKVSKPLTINDKISLSYCQSNRVDSSDKITGSWKTYTESLDPIQFTQNFILDGDFFIEKFLINKNVIPNASAVLFRKEKLQISNQLFNTPALRYCGDWVIYFQVIMKQEVSFIAESLNNFRYHDNSVIAVVSKSEKKLALIDIDLQMRNVMDDLLKQNTSANKHEIIKNNTKITKELKYDKALILFNDKQKWKAIVLVFGIMGFFIKKYPFRKRLNQLFNF